MTTMARYRILIAILLLAVAPSMMGAKGGCGGKLEEAKLKVPDFSGNYAITHQDQITVKVTIGGATETYTGVAGGVIDLGEATLDFTEVCKYEGVHCPSEAFWNEVAIDQPLFDPTKKPHNPWLVRVVNLDTTTEAYTMERGGLTNKDGDLVIGLGLGATGVPGCILLGASVATGVFDLSAATGLPTGTISDGKVIVAYAGGCLFPNESGFAAATITLESTFTGQRTGSFELPSELATAPILDEDGNEVNPE